MGYLKMNERMKIEAWLESGMKPIEIAKRLHRCTATIYREIKLGSVELLDTNLLKYNKYCADAGQRIADERSHNKGRDLKVGNDLKFIKYLEKMILEEKYSPVAILANIKRENLQFDTNVCYKTIYNYVHNHVLLNVDNSNLPMPRKKKEIKKTKKRPAYNHAKDHTSIEERPKDIYKRLEYGHWELDTVESGKGDKACLFVFTERKTREELIYKATGKTEKELSRILNCLERQLTAPLFRETFKTITVDNGCEFCNQNSIEKSVINKIMKRTQVYYCHPYCAYERGSNENANKLIRRWISKGEHISKFTAEYIKNIQDWINNYPRKLFDYMSSNEYKKVLGLLS